MNFEQDPHAIPFTVTDKAPAVMLSPAADAMSLRLAECDVTMYMHDPLDGNKPYLVIDIDNEDGLLPVVIYRNDTMIYDEETLQAQQQKGTTT